MDPRKASVWENRVVPVEVTVPISIDPNDPNKLLSVDSQLGVKAQKELILFLPGVMLICAEYLQKLWSML